MACAYAKQIIMKTTESVAYVPHHVILVMAINRTIAIHAFKNFSFWEMENVYLI